MSDNAITPDAWEISARSVEDGVRIRFTIPPHDLDGEIQVTRAEARAFARCLLAAAGDAMERTFPTPATPEASHG